MTNIYPQHAQMFHDEALILVGSGPLVIGHDSNQDYAFVARLTSHANNDSFTQSCMLEAGTYTFWTEGYTDTNQGKLDWYIDNVLIVSGEDWYSNPFTYNVINFHNSINVVGSGRHVLKGVVNGKNASSSDYYILLTKYWFTPTTDTISV